MLDIKKYTNIIFDCDGVILNSNAVKSDAFAKSLKGEDKLLIDEFVKYHKKNGGISRFVKFDYFFKIIKKKKEYNSDLEKSLEIYSKLSHDGLLNCDLINGVRDILESLYSHKIDCFVISGGEQEEVRSVLSKRNLSYFFKGIYGSPLSKKNHLKKLNLDNALYFGDALADFNAAKDFNIDFIYINGASEWSNGMEFCRRNKVPVFQDFSEIRLPVA